VLHPPVGAWVEERDEALPGHEVAVAVFYPDWRVVGYSLGLALLAAGIAGVSPVLESLRFGPAGVLRPLRPSDGTHTSARMRGTLIAHQISITLTLLVALGLVVRAQDRMLKPHLGYDPQAVIVTSIDFTRLGYSAWAARAFYDQLLPRLEAMPGVAEIALSSFPPSEVPLGRRSPPKAGIPDSPHCARCRRTTSA
jgi:hypothetical protein